MADSKCHHPIEFLFPEYANDRYTIQRDARSIVFFSWVEGCEASRRRHAPARDSELREIVRCVSSGVSLAEWRLSFSRTFPTDILSRLLDSV